MKRQSIRGRRITGLFASLAAALAIAAVPGCGGVEEGTLDGEQAPEITEANNAMMDYAKEQGQPTPP